LHANLRSDEIVTVVMTNPCRQVALLHEELDRHHKFFRAEISCAQRLLRRVQVLRARNLQLNLLDRHR